MSHDTWIHRGVRTLVRPLARTRVTPNQITALRLATGLGAAGSFAAGTSGASAWAGAALFVVSMICDRADGELARLSGRTSERGHFYDVLTDGISDAAVLLGLGIGLPAGALGGWSLAAGAIAAAAVASIFAAMLAGERRLGPGTLVIGGAGGFDPDDAMVAIPIAVCLGWAEALVAAAAICAPLAAGVVVTGIRRRVRAGAPGASSAAPHPHEAHQRPDQVERRADAG